MGNNGNNLKNGLASQRRGSNSSGVSSGGEAGSLLGGEGLGGYKQVGGGSGMVGTASSGLATLLRALDTAGDMDQSGPPGASSLGAREASAAGVSS
jgi:hypothetical protein